MTGALWMANTLAGLLSLVQRLCRIRQNFAVVVGAVCASELRTLAMSPAM